MQRYPMMMHAARGKCRSTLWFLVLLCLMAPPANEALAQADPRNRLESEGFPALRELEEYYRHLQGIQVPEDKEVPIPGHSVNFSFNGSNVRVLIRRPENDPVAIQVKEYEKVYGINPRYSFMLRRGGPTEPFAIDWVGPDSEEFRHKTVREAGLFISIPCNVFWKGLPDWQKTGGFSIEGVGQIEKQGKSLVRVNIKYAPDSPAANSLQAVPPFRGYVNLDPARRWCICENEFTLELYRGGQKAGENLIRQTVEFGDDIDGMPMPRKIRTDTKNERFTVSSVVSFNDIKKCNASVSEFTLVAFGLPDVAGFNQHQSSGSSWLWIVALAAALVVLAGLFAWLARRYAARNA